MCIRDRTAAIRKCRLEGFRPTHPFAAFQTLRLERRDILLVSAYFICGICPTGRNLELLYDLMLYLKALDLPFIIGADWNMEPQLVDAALSAVGLRTRVCQTGTPTCGDKVLDYVITGNGADHWVRGVRISEGIPLNPPHKVVECLLLAEPLAATPGAERMGHAYFGLYLLAMGLRSWSGIGWGVVLVFLNIEQNIEHRTLFSEQ